MADNKKKQVPPKPKRHAKKSRTTEAAAPAPVRDRAEGVTPDGRVLGADLMDPGTGGDEGTPKKPFPIVGIGASAGGLEAFSKLLQALPSDTGMGFVFVQHMDPKHESMLNRLLAKDTAMAVVEVREGMAVEPNRCYVIPPNTEMTIREGLLRLATRPPIAARHTPIDSFLIALAEDQKGKAIGIVLSGVGSDGTRGLEAIKAEGGVTFAQDEGSAKYGGMPQQAVASGCVDFVLPPEKIAQELARIGSHPYLELKPQEAPDLLVREDSDLLRIFKSLRATTGVDFRQYKIGTIRRRIARRMLVQRCETLPQYVKYVEAHPEEVNALFQDLLIHVTSFFREPEMFEVLKTTLLPRLAPKASLPDSIRVWVAGCSTGEEVYSLAIELYEYLGDAAHQTHIQIFGTDISESDVQKARSGYYEESRLTDVSPERLRRFFVKADVGYQVVKFLRETCIFARHDLTRDPPFSRMDLISCRNVMIYLAPLLQRRIFGVFEYALKPGGFLVLGKSEGISSRSDLFQVEDRQNNIYSKRAGPPSAAPPRFQPLEHPWYTEPRREKPKPPPAFDLQKEADRLLLQRYAPPGFIVDADLQIIHLMGDTAPFLKPASGEPSFHLLKMVRSELMVEIRSALAEAKRKNAAVRREGIPIDRRGSEDLVNIEVSALPGRHAKGPDFLVVFREAQAEPPRREKPVSRRRPEKKRVETVRLRQELSSAQEHLRSLVEDNEASAEELRAANEEVLSSNEELQSTNEELETAKEELQSSNEELTTLNDELRNRNLELHQAVGDLSNVLNAVEIPIVILGENLGIRRFTPSAGRLLNLIPADMGRPIGQIHPNIELPKLEALVSEVMQSSRPLEREVQDRQGRWYALRLRPYKTARNVREGVLMVLVDIDDVKRSAAAIVETVREPLLVLDPEYRVLTANPAFYQKFWVPPEQTENQLLFELGNGQWNIPRLRELLQAILPEKKEVADFEVSHEFPAIGKRIMLLHARQLFEAGVGMQKILLVMEDITQRREYEAALHQGQEKLRAISGRLLTAREDEARRLARELHDVFGQRMAVLNISIGKLENQISSDPKAATERLRQIAKEFRELSESLQDLSRRLHPAILQDLGLEIALKGECSQYQQRYGILVSFKAEKIPKLLPEDMALSVYRVAQESLLNVAKHSQAKRADVKLLGQDNHICLSVSDQGDGFDVENLRGKGLGLISMGERVRALGGEFSITSKPGQGTQVDVRIPLERS